MSDDKKEEMRLPEMNGPPPQQSPPPAVAPSNAGGCLRVVAILIVGVFVLAGLVFATCFLSLRR